MSNKDCAVVDVEKSGREALPLQLYKIKMLREWILPYIILNFKIKILSVFHLSIITYLCFVEERIIIKYFPREHNWSMRLHLTGS